MNPVDENESKPKRVADTNEETEQVVIPVGKKRRPSTERSNLSPRSEQAVAAVEADGATHTQAHLVEASQEQQPAEKEEAQLPPGGDTRRAYPHNMVRRSRTNRRLRRRSGVHLRGTGRTRYLPNHVGRLRRRGAHRDSATAQ